MHVFVLYYEPYTNTEINNLFAQFIIASKWNPLAFSKSVYTHRAMLCVVVAQYKSPGILRITTTDKNVIKHSLTDT